MNIVSIRVNPEYMERAIQYFQDKWATTETMMLYEDCITHCINAPTALPQWYLLLDGEFIIGCAGLITNDFISRMDLYPWLCALYIEEAYRGRNLATLLIQQARNDAKSAGFARIYLCTDRVGYYEKHSFEHIGTGYHPWGESSRVYALTL